MKKTFLMLFIILSALSFFSNNMSFGRDSVIDDINMIKPSIVELEAGILATRSNQLNSMITNPNIADNVPVNQSVMMSASKKAAGIIISSDGYIIANYHLVQFTNSIKATLHDGTVVFGKIASILPQYDLALIKINVPYSLQSVIVADSNYVNLGLEVINIGNSYLLKKTISSGYVTRLATRFTKGITNVEFIQTNIQLQPGDSGGPLLTLDGQLVGLVAAKLSAEKGITATLAIPSNKITFLYESFISNQAE